MSCYYPKLAYKQFKNEEGKWQIKFIPDRADYNISRLRQKYGDDLMLLPCGECLGCKFDKARDWATRCALEMQYHQEACFVTLTYDNKHYPGKLIKSHLIQFVKDLRNRGANLRYVGAGEYGETTHRAHYHIILFGYRPDDLEFHSKGSDGDFLYTSKTLEAIWSKGFVIVGDCTYQSAGYVARYTTKKIANDDGFLVCSNRPGIGYQYYLDHCQSMLETGFVYGEFGEKYRMPVPRYFDKLLLRDFPERYEALNRKRIDLVQKLQSNALVNAKCAHQEILCIEAAEALDRKLNRFTR